MTRTVPFIAFPVFSSFSLSVSLDSTALYSQPQPAANRLLFFFRVLLEFDQLSSLSPHSSRLSRSC